MLISAHLEMNKWALAVCFQIRNETFFCKVKLKIPDFEREKSRDCAETYIWYVAQGIPLIDAGIAKKGHF
jgi:hypothetical protein